MVKTNQLAILATSTEGEKPSGEGDHRRAGNGRCPDEIYGSDDEKN